MLEWGKHKNGPLAQLVEQLTLNPSENTQLVNKFIDSRREGLSPRTIEFYTECLARAKYVIGVQVSGHDIAHFLKPLKYTNGGRHGYYLALRCFYNWLYSYKSGYGFDPQSNPMLQVEPPKVERIILPSLTVEQVTQLIDQAETTRGRAIISLFVDSGLRLMELANINLQNIDWEDRLIKVRIKGNKEGLAAFGAKPEKLLRRWLSECNTNGNLWDIS